MTQVVLHEPQQTDRTTAAAVHIGAIFAPLIVPIVAYVVTRNKREFVAAHARQSLTETIVLNVLLGAAMLCSTAYTVWRLWNFYQNDWQDFSIWEFIVRFIVGWVLLGILWVVNLIVSIVQALQALRGKWPRSAVRRLTRGKSS